MKQTHNMNYETNNEYSYRKFTDWSINFFIIGIVGGGGLPLPHN